MSGKPWNVSPFSKEMEAQADKIAKEQGRPCYEVFGCWHEDRPGIGIVCRGDCGHAVMKYLSAQREEGQDGSNR